MFRKDDYVFYESGGICKITDVQISPLEGMPRDREYYVLKSIGENNGVMYIPVDAKGIFLRRLISREEAECLIDGICEVEVFDAPNAKLLRTQYTEAMHAHRPSEWIRVIKTVYQRLNTDSKRSLRISDTERSFGDLAKRYLYTELSIALEIPLTEVEAFIKGRVEKTDLS